ncbi:MAG: HDOD domain-containing protein [Gammaproteobacteria bacterium]
MPKIAFILKESIPPFHFLAKIIQTLSRAEQTTDIRELIRVIKQEPATIAKILQISNSAAYMGSKKTSSIESAAALMGISELKSVVLSSVIASKFNTQKCPNFKTKDYWLESVLTGENSASIYKHLVKTDNSYDIDIYCVGLLSNIGLLFLVDQFPEILNTIFTEVTEEKSLSSLLVETFGLDEYQLSAKLLSFWKLPDIFSGTAENILNFDYQDQYIPYIETIRNAKKITHITLHPPNNTIVDDNEKETELELPNLSNENIIDITSRSKNNLEKNKLIAEALCR